ncbi:MAG: hypothetical protein LJE91_00400 [Gammaproteobacteria bacterium]|jgi:hypothetical protein|nr:hypothetical protein [Gammaproteobacteria bacterium]
MNTTDAGYAVRGALCITLLALLLTAGCASRAPTIAHTHIGHAMTGWHDTPEKGGLFTTAEVKADEALKAAEAASAASDLQGIQSGIEATMMATDPQYETSPGGVEVKAPYGVRQALTGAVAHISFAASSPDASDNVKESSEPFAQSAQAVLDRSDLILALGSDILVSRSTEEARILGKEVLLLARANVFGDDSDGDGIPGSSPGEYGMRQLRDEIQAMIDREDPPYTTVDTWYLFNLVKLPSGQWVFKQRPASSSGGYY